MTPVRRELPVGLGRALGAAVVAFARTHGIVIGVLAALVAGAAVLGLAVVAHGIALLALGLLATVVHELGHVAAYRMLSPRAPAVLESELLRAALHREPLTPRADRAVTLAGPLAPLLIVAALVPFAGALPAELVGAAVVAVAHAASMLLPTADRRAWRQVAPRNSGAAARRGVERPATRARS